ncbi:hypothetical protein [Sphingobacterium deserti]|uniref:DUF2383 domain-containing protein n=1 Tax=Sphingobacterium deserti TaxID=1229276 RepID=A0A0B8T4U6_9SPHI|nr:hypothetical protein [Sphingobacterium deserti]KGE12284.1 hypothetical protein DI53_3934 [Sphingobacterium deserti]
MKNTMMKESILTLVTAIEKRMVVYKKALVSSQKYADNALSKVFQQYYNESYAFSKQLIDDFKLTINLSAEGKIVKMQQDNIDHDRDLYSTIVACRKIEDLCKDSYLDAIRDLDETFISQSFRLREQAENQYMASNHINTLLDCYRLDSQAV